MSKLTLPIKKKWFDMIVSGEKKEEYRELNLYWVKRLRFEFTFFGSLQPCSPGQRTFDTVELRNGYGKSVPSATFELEKPVKIGTGKPEWGAEPGKLYFVLTLGKRPEMSNEKLNFNDLDDLFQEGYINGNIDNNREKIEANLELIHFYINRLPKGINGVSSFIVNRMQKRALPKSNESIRQYISFLICHIEDLILFKFTKNMIPDMEGIIKRLEKITDITEEYQADLRIIQEKFAASKNIGKTIYENEDKLRLDIALELTGDFGLDHIMESTRLKELVDYIVLMATTTVIQETANE